MSPFELVQFSMETEEPVRDKQGFCIPVGPGMEVGEPFPGVGRLETLCLLHGWNKPPKASRLVPRGWCLQPFPRPRFPGLSDHSLGPSAPQLRPALWLGLWVSV